MFLLSIEWNSIKLGGPAHGIVTKTVHTSLAGGGGEGDLRGGKGRVDGKQGILSWMECRYFENI